ncbi:MAG: exodeoxyribonuclease V subunit beta [Spongiibacteraceae bacterium]|jgi:exodeoxyribonuclease V beta subunit|nr:exodeoxyribonuclease V subunit beta [Spongiibacteraceae bacterium]
MTLPLNPLTFPLHGARLIEASAGTGKTWTIASLYLRLVLGHGGGNAFPRPLAPEEILVVTFTRAATEELRDRIRARLTEAALFFAQGAEGQGDPLLQQLRGDYPEAVWPAQAYRLRLAAGAMDQAAVLTIHGWCQRMLRQHAFASGIPFGIELNGDDRALREQVARDYWRTFIQPLPVGLMELIRQEVRTPEALAAAIAGMPIEEAGQTDDKLPFADDCAVWLQRCDELEGAARRACEAEVATVRAWFDEALASKWLNGNSHRATSVAEQLAALEAWVQEGQPRQPDKLVRLLPERFKFNKAHEHRVPEWPGFATLARYLEHLEAAPALREPLLRHAACWCAARLRAQKQRLGELGYDDLLARLHEALHGPQGERLATLIREQFPVALIDEFQDTDPLQYAMFAKVFGWGAEAASAPVSDIDQGEAQADLFAESSAPSGTVDSGALPTGLLMIGDPKQAIYAFRGADIYAYLQARRDTEGRHYTLGTNYRSVTGMVAAVNRIFARGSSWPDGPFLFGDEIPYLPVNANGRPERLEVGGAPQAPLTLWRPADYEPRKRGTYCSEMAEACASAIVELLNGAAAGRVGFRRDGVLTPLAASDIAILVRRGSEASQVRAALTARGLKSVYLSDRDSVYASAEARDLLCWLEAVEAPERADLLRRALATATLGLPLVELERLRQEEHYAEAMIERFRDYHTLWARRGVLPMLRRLLDDFGLPSILLQRPGGERALTNLLHLAELAQQAAQRLAGTAAVIREFSERIERAVAGDTNDEYVQRLESDADLIRVVTIHKSKGLEYPLVFLPFACRPRPEFKGNGSPSYFDEALGRRRVVFQSDDTVKALVAREQLAEDLRLLYVALTRARHACWVGLAPIGQYKKNGEYRCELQDTAMGYLLNGGAAIEPERLHALLAELASEEIVVTDTPAPSHARYDGVPQTGSSDRPLRTPLPRARRPWWVASYSALVATLQATGETPDAEASGREAKLIELARERSDPARTPDPASIHAFPAGAAAGTFLHDLLEWAAREGFGRVCGDDALRRAEVERRCSRRGWEEWVPVLDQWLVTVLSAPLPVAGGGVALAQLATLLPEMEFWLEAHGMNTAAVDQLLRRYLLPGERRPALEPKQLQGMLKGFIDLIFEHDGRYYVIDYKSNWLGPDTDSYTTDAMNHAILEHRYELQYALYSVALHRLLRSRLPGYQPERHLGGVFYLFLRGLGADGEFGIHQAQLPMPLIEALDRMLQGSEVKA